MMRTTTFQKNVMRWCVECFSQRRAEDPNIRILRFLEEALELAQATGVGPRVAQQVLTYVYGRPAGEFIQEVGGCVTTLAALCEVMGVDMRSVGEAALADCYDRTDEIREKDAAKPAFSDRPGSGLVYSYDVTRDLFTIEGIVYSGELLRYMGHGDVDRWFKIVTRQDGVVTIFSAPPGARLRWEERYGNLDRQGSGQHNTTG